MPITKTITLYAIDELSETAREKAIQELWDINVDCEWWDFIVEEAAKFGIRIDEFDLDHRTIKGGLTEQLLDSAQSIISETGSSCDIHTVAEEYVEKYMEAYKEWRKNQDEDGCEAWTDDNWLTEFKYSDEDGELCDEYKKAILEEYLVILRREEDYLTSSSAILDTIRANEYTFTEEGKMENC